MTKKKIGKYTYSGTNQLGRGEFAEVYLAEENGQSDEVAIKIFFEKFREIFKKECEIYQYIKNLNLQNPHILSFIEAGEDDGRPYIVFQQAQEETLRDQIKQLSGKPFGTERALAILIQIGDAITALHGDNINVIHGDIRPENILFDKDNQALLTDFGMAVRISSEDDKEGKHRPSPHGDPLYMAPERFGSDSFIAKESDQYSLGCIAYELFTGRHLLRLVTPQDATLDATLVERQIKTTKIDKPHEYNKLLPKFLEDAILKALAKEPKERHGSVEEFINELTKTPAVIGYGQRYPTQQSLPQDLRMSAEEGYFKHLTSFLQDKTNGYEFDNEKTLRLGTKTFTYTLVSRSGDARNLVYVPARFIVNPNDIQHAAIYSMMRRLLDTELPTLIFYDSFEAPAFSIIKSCDELEALQVGIWFIPMKYMYDFEAPGGVQKEWVEDLWLMTRSYKKRKSSL